MASPRRQSSKGREVEDHGKQRIDETGPAWHNCPGFYHIASRALLREQSSENYESSAHR